MKYENPFPRYYGRDEMTLLVRDATTLYSYWEITWERRAFLSNYIGSFYDEQQKWLRLYDVTHLDFLGDYANSIRDIPVDHDADEWYIHHVNSDCNYVADYGLFYDGKFQPIIRSNVIQTPRNTAAVWGEYIIPRISVEKGKRIPPNYFESFGSYSFYD
ncbi:MAG TPA: DUF4912 domain-containing protein [Bacillota bacterium]|nr:DUF4912 domain-containing protein [Bacillota bacterium]